MCDCKRTTYGSSFRRKVKREAFLGTVFKYLFFLFVCLAMPFAAYACDQAGVGCASGIEIQTVPVQDVPVNSAMTEQHEEAGLPENAADETKNSPKPAMVKTDGYYEVDIENGDFYYFE